MTHTAKHTPGPLDNVTGYKPGPWIRQVLNDESEAYIHDKHCNAIARVYSLSDAAIIAAAPAMYADAKQLCELVRDFMNDNRLYDGQVIQAISNLETALSQAEGRDK